VTSSGDYFERHPHRVASCRGDLGVALWESHCVASHCVANQVGHGYCERDKETAKVTTLSEEKKHGEEDRQEEGR
jgi:hypothetical protein